MIVTGLLISAIFVSLLLLACHYYIQSLFNIHCQFGIKKGDSVLLVVSHPDDECLFFSPTILYLKKKEIKVSVLCLSTGNFYGLAKQRINELISSCKNLGVLEHDIICLDEFKDDPVVVWSTESIADAVEKYITKVHASAVFTFDDNGVSGHLNHKATCSGVRYLHARGSLNKEVKFHFLNTVCLLRKYVQVLDIFASCGYSLWKKSSILIVASPLDYVIAYRSMLCHRSQLVWFRYLMIVFSRYMIMNTWMPIKDDVKID